MTPASRARRTQTERRAETERRLLEATMTIIAEHGVHAVTAAAVGEAAGYSRGIVHHQFGTRQALLTVVAKTVQSRFDPNPDKRDGREHVLTLVARYLTSLRSEPQDIRVFLRLMTAAISGEEPGLQAVFVQRDEHFRQHVAEALADGERSVDPCRRPPHGDRCCDRRATARHRAAVDTRPGFHRARHATHRGRAAHRHGPPTLRVTCRRET